MIESVSQTSDLSDDMHSRSKAPIHLTVFPTDMLGKRSPDVRPTSRHCSPMAMQAAVDGERRLNGGFSSRRRPVIGRFDERSQRETDKGKSTGVMSQGQLVHSRMSPIDPRLGCHRLRTIRSKGGLLAGTPREAASGEVHSVTCLYTKKPVLFHRLAIEFNAGVRIREARKGQPRLRLLLYKHEG